MQDGVLPKVKGLYFDSSEKPLALIITHAHLDHYGLAGQVQKDIPVHVSIGTRDLFDVSRIFLPRPVVFENVNILPKKKPVTFGPFSVTAYPVDHSAPDSMALLIEAEGKRVFYSGDLRSHGRKGYLFEELVKNAPMDIDCLLLEGTMIDRIKQEFEDESAVEDALADVLRSKSNLALLFCSSQNLDRIVSAFRAVKKTDSILVIDLYTAFVLDKLQSISNNLPQYHWPEVRVKYWKSHADSLAKAGLEQFLFDVNPRKIQIEEIVEKRSKILMLAKANRLLGKVTEQLPDLNGLELIWSMWSGYLTGDDVVSRFSADSRVPIRQIHTGGHATADDLARLAAAIKPKVLVPVHTFAPDRFTEIADNVVVAKDGESFSI